MRILGIAGSVRRGSHNRRLIRAWRPDTLGSAMTTSHIVSRPSVIDRRSNSSTRPP